jgi:hypothetical protein
MQAQQRANLSEGRITNSVIVHESHQFAPAAADLRGIESRGAGLRPVFAHPTTPMHLMVAQWQWTRYPCVVSDAHRAELRHSPAHPLLPIPVT